MTSAEQTAWVRALAARETDREIRNPDYLAEHFVEGGLARSLKFPRLTKLALQVMAPGFYYYHLARTKHIDHTLRAALDAGLDQLVLLGAGYDSRPQRFRERLQNVRIFELDFPATQARKQQRLNAAAATLPNRHTFVPIDFNHQSIEERLHATSYDVSARTFFVWEGVSMFLEPSAVERVLEFGRSKAARGSEIIFDYIVHSVIHGDHRPYGAKQSFKHARKLGEPYRFGLDPAQVRAYLSERGFELCSDAGAAELERAYLASPHGERKAWGFIRLAHARSI